MSNQAPVAVPESGTITDRQVAFYRDQGYLVVERLFGPADVARLNAATAALVERSRLVRVHDEVFELEPDHRPEAPRLQRIKAPHKVDQAYFDIIRDERLLAVLRRLLGPAVRLQNSKLNLKSSGGAPVEWHQDWAFYPYTNDDVLAVGVMLDDMTPDNGPLMVVPGSHRGPLYNHHSDGLFCGSVDTAVAADALKHAAPVIAPAGSVSFHHARALHGSDVNRSGADRRLLLFEVMAADAWPLAGSSARWVDHDEFRSRLLCGDEPEVPRMESAPIRPPQPAHQNAGSIFAFQKLGQHRYYAPDGTGAPKDKDAKIAET